MLKGLELSPGLTVRHGLEGIGGGRGIFSTSSFRTGELVLQENPIIESPESIQVRLKSGALRKEVPTFRVESAASQSA